jgi:hypothetical protein
MKVMVRTNGNTGFQHVYRSSDGFGWVHDKALAKVFDERSPEWGLIKEIYTKRHGYRLVYVWDK